MMPNFLIVGASKSGTTSLYYYLRQHPDVFLPAEKEPHYFAPAKWCGRPVPGREEYRHLFDPGRGRKAVGEASTGYLYYPDSPDRIHREIPDCRIIAMLRDPVERAWSGYCHELREGMEQVSFEQALAEERSGVLRRVNGDDFSFNYIRQGFVHDLLRRYLDLFGPERVGIWLFEDLAAHPEALMRAVFEFLGVDPGFQGDWSYRYNPSGVPRSVWLHELLDGKGGAHRIAARAMRRLLPPAVRDPLWQRLRDWNIRLGRKPELRRETRRMLEIEFETEISRLERLLGRSLSGWRRPPANTEELRCAAG
jgi:hypothetical protein